MSVSPQPADLPPTSAPIPRTTVSLRVFLAGAFATLAGALVVMATIAVGETGIRRVRLEIEHSLDVLADQMQDKIDRGLYERYREVTNFAAVLGNQQNAETRLDGRQTWLETVQSTYPEYAWLGIVAADGRVLSATSGFMVGSNMADRPWFKDALNHAIVGDVREDKLLADRAPADSDPFVRFVDVAAPIIAPDGTHIAVLVASLNWTWAREVRDSLFAAESANHTEDVIVLSRDGMVLLGPRVLEGHHLELDMLKAAQASSDRSIIETWPDGHRYVTGFARSDGYRSFQGLGLTVLVRANAIVALAPATRLQREIIGWGIGLAGLAALIAWLIAGRMASPMLILANAAAKMRRGEVTEIPDVGTYAEAEALAQSLKILLSELNGRQRALAALNTSLESQVAERTRRLAEQNIELETAKVAAEQATAAKSRFLAAASHDLRQPLHAMTLFARALKRRVPSGEAARLVTQLDQSLLSLREMFDTLLNVSRLDAGLVSARVTPVSLGDLIDHISIGLRADAEHRGLVFRTHTLDAVIVTDAAILETMIRNLAANALKFTSTGGILIATRRRRSGLAIEIYDTGPGIPADKRELIFEEFERSASHARGVNDGLGLGLSIVRRYAGLLDLTVEVRSRHGRGSRFSIIIPLSAEIAKRRPIRVGAAKRVADLRGRHILILDDDALIVEALSRDIADRGGEPRGFSSAAAAEHAIATGFAPDAAVIDYDLRLAETGPDVISRLARQLGKPIPSLVLSGATDGDTLTDLVRSGHPWMTKPASPDDIAATVYELCKRSSASRTSLAPLQN